MDGGILPYALAPVLFLGPIYANYLDGDLLFQRRTPGSWWTRIKGFYSSLGLIEMRNYVVVSLICSDHRLSMSLSMAKLPQAM